MHSCIPSCHELSYDETAAGLTLCAPPASRKLRDVSGSLHPHDEVADSLRLGALFVHSTHEISGASQAFCTPMMKIADSLRRCAPPPHENCGTPQALCAPMMNFEDSLRL